MGRAPLLCAGQSGAHCRERVCARERRSRSRSCAPGAPLAVEVGRLRSRSVRLAVERLPGSAARGSDGAGAARGRGRRLRGRRPRPGADGRLGWAVPGFVQAAVACWPMSASTGSRPRPAGGAVRARSPERRPRSRAALSSAGGARVQVRWPARVGGAGLRSGGGWRAGRCRPPRAAVTGLRVVRASACAGAPPAVEGGALISGRRPRPGAVSGSGRRHRASLRRRTAWWPASPR